jgi:glutamate N-acetyltransferase/amino-acid N-acetyltransferase
MKKVGGGVTAPAGFLGAGIHAGIKKASIPDLALLVSPTPATVAGVFTTNRVVAAPVIVDRARLRGGLAQAVIVTAATQMRVPARKGWPMPKRWRGWLLNDSIFQSGASSSARLE